ncbi:MAG: hypothetical protein P8100_00815 [bacterium]
MLTTLNDQETMALGLDVDWISFYWQQFHLYNAIPYDIVTFQFYQKVGPSFTIMPTEKIAIDIFARAVVSWFAASAFIENEDTDDAEGYGRVFTMGYSTGANFRFSIRMVGVEFCSMSPKLENFDDPDKIFGNLRTNGDRTLLPSMNFTDGLSF